MVEIPTDEELDRLDQMNHALMREYVLLNDRMPSVAQYNRTLSLMLYKENIMHEAEVVEDDAA